VPSTGGLTSRTAPSCSSGSVTLQPGIYASINFSGSCAAHLQPGTYYISSGGISISGSALLDGDGVFIYNAAGAIDLSGTGAFHLTPPTSGPYKGLLLFQARTNASTLSLSGNGAIEGMHGTIYGPTMPVRISGNGNLPAQFVSDSLTMSGNGTLDIQYSASEVYGVPSTALLE